MKTKTPEHQAAIAVRAAKLERKIGSRMARLYARRHNCMSLFILARMLERGNVRTYNGKD